MVEQKCKWCGQSTIPQCVADTDNQILLHANCEAAWERCREEAAKECERRATVALSRDSDLADLLADMHTDTAEIIRAMEPPNA